ncbi:aldose 1-epimerase [Bacteroidia bacterium]|nr:aldose 1-epimerase [Bacteroidia bacterium]GHT05125.1 aldose 1-epimerase [Bacteroidia bacterium]
MKKIVFAFAALCLLFVSCGKKVVETETLSGLLPSNFEYTTEDGDVNRLYVMKNAQGMEVTVINIGARIVSLVVPGKDGSNRNVVLGFDSIEPYLQLKNYYGAIVGRYANRIADGTFELDRVTYRIRQNEGKNQLHGGPRGFSTRYFTIEQPTGQSLVCSYFSKDGDEGFPGDLKLTVTYTLTNENTLDVDYHAITNRATYINVSNHAYFNLSGADANTIADQQLYIDASNYTPVREDLIPTGKIAKVEPVLDYTTLRPIDADYPYDLNYVLNAPGNIDALAAQVVSPTTGLSMEIYTTEPGIQFYNDRKRPAICLEPQHFPDSPHHPNFPSTILRVDSVFNSKTIYKFKVNS